MDCCTQGGEGRTPIRWTYGRSPEQEDLREAFGNEDRLLSIDLDVNPKLSLHLGIVSDLPYPSLISQTTCRSLSWKIEKPVRNWVLCVT
jgi:hypothetical protein